jgi:hypothetical protein
MLLYLVCESKRSCKFCQVVGLKPLKATYSTNSLPLMTETERLLNIFIYAVRDNCKAFAFSIFSFVSVVYGLACIQD